MIDFLLRIARRGESLHGLTTERLAQLLAEELLEEASRSNTELLVTVAGLVKKSIRLKILILGPGESGGEIYRKRCEVRELLTRLGHEAHFCEDIWTPDVLERSGLNLAIAEYIQARAYDYVVCLMASPGSIGEAHDLAKDRRIAVKMMICVDGQHKSGYSAQGILRIFEGYNGKLDWFQNPTDIAECHLATRIVQHIQKVAERKQWELATGSGAS